jgi:hypothetical protein
MSEVIGKVKDDIIVPVGRHAKQIRVSMVTRTFRYREREIHLGDDVSEEERVIFGRT